MAQKYIRRGGMDVQPAPWISQQPLHAYIFQVPATGASLQALCDRCLNDPSAGTPGALHYAPVPLAINDYVALTFQHFGGLRSHSGNADRPGMHHYNEASFWVMTANSGGPIEMFIPYMFVNDWVALASGREVYGFPKEYADILRMPADGPGTFMVEALALKSLAAPGDAISQRILQCVPTGGFGPLDILLQLLQGIDLWPLIEELPGEDLSAFLAPLLPVWGVLKMLRAGRLPLVFLRQFRALAGGDGADLQQIAAAEASPFKVNKLSLLEPHELTIFPLDSHPIADELGLPVDKDGKILLPICLELEIEFGIQPGRVVWQP